MLERGTVERFPGPKARGVSPGHTLSRFLLSPSLQVPAVCGKGSPRSRTIPAPGRGRAAQTRTRLVQQAGAWLQMHLLHAPAALQLCSSFPVLVAASSPASRSVCACAPLLAPGTISQARSGPFFPCPSCAGSTLGGWQLLVWKWWPAAGDGTSFRRSRQTFWVMSEGSLNFRSPCGMLSNPNSPLGTPGVERWTHRSRTAAAGISSLGPTCKPELPSACSWMKTDCNYPCLLPKNALFPGKWSWDGKGEHGAVPCCPADQ